MFETQLTQYVRNHVFFRFYINSTKVKSKFQCSQKEYGIQKHILKDDQEYAFNYIKCTKCKSYQLTVAVHSITANLSRPPAGQAHPYQSWLGQRRGLQLGVQLLGALTKLIRPKSCPQGFLLLGWATKLWGFPSEVSLIFTQSLQQTERCLSSEGCMSCFWW